MNNQINTETLQQQKQDEIKIPADEKKNITHLSGGIWNWVLGIGWHPYYKSLIPNY
jgi:hypothetical protein